MTHFKSGESKAQATSPEWLKVGKDIGYMANKWALRDDIVAYVGPGAGGNAPACFNISSAEIEVNVDVAFGAGVSPDAIGDITTRKVQYEFPRATGAILHEAFHARYSLWSLPKAYEDLEKNQKVFDALVLLEESRIEYQGLQANSKARPFLRASAIELAIGDAREGFEVKQPTIAISNLVGLVHSRIDAGILDAHEVADIVEWVNTQIDSDKVTQLRDLARLAQMHDKHRDATELYPIAKEWVRIVDEIAKERGENPDEKPEGCFPIPKELADKIMEIMKEVGEEVEMNNFGELSDQEQSEDFKEEAKSRADESKEQLENEEIASEVFDKSTGVGTSKTNSRLKETRQPNAEERSASVRIGELMEKAKYRERDITDIDSQTPPGRLKTRAIIQNKALRERGVVSRENPFRRTVRKQTDEPTLNVGIMVDISGSMGSAMNPMATTAWVMSEAVNRIQGNCAMVYYGNDVFPTLKVGQRLPEVNVYTAPDGTEKFTKAFKALDGELNLLYGNGARLLVIVSDGQYTSEETRSAKEIIRKCESAGVAVLWLPFDYGSGAREIGQGYAEIVSDITDPAGASELIGMKAMEVMTRVGQRQVA
jgi:hypothetical protein